MEESEMKEDDEEGKWWLKGVLVMKRHGRMTEKWKDGGRL